MNVVTRHLRRLADFSGRENREPFWLWVLSVYVAQMALGMLAWVPMSMRMSGAMQAMAGQDQSYLNAHPDLAMQAMMRMMMPFMRDMMIFSTVLGLVCCALLAAAVVRRLHDGNRAGWWAAPVVALQLVTPLAWWRVLPRFFAAMGSMRPETSPEQMSVAMTSIMPAFALLGLLGVLGFIFTIGLIVLLALRGTTGPNRYGDDLLPPPAAVPPWRPAPATGPLPPARVPAARIVADRPNDRPPIV